MSNMLKTKSGQWVILPTEEEDKALQAAAMADPDALLLTDEQVTTINDIGLNTQDSLGDLQSEAETLYLLALPGMSDSIKKGMGEPIDECDKDLYW
jgi:hypothetical protein